MHCPKCSGSMEAVTFAQVDVDRCTACGGLWFDRLELDKLRDQPGSHTLDSGDIECGQQQNERGDIDCPRCSAHMVKMVDLEQPHVWYEMCSTCGGMYFDAGEFSDLKQHNLLDTIRRLVSRYRPRV